MAREPISNNKMIIRITSATSTLSPPGTLGHPVFTSWYDVVMLWGLGFGGEIQLKITHSLVRQLIYALNLD